MLMFPAFPMPLVEVYKDASSVKDKFLVLILRKPPFPKSKIPNRNDLLFFDEFWGEINMRSGIL